jgi:surface antigen
MRLPIATLLAIVLATATLPAQAYVPFHWLVTSNSNYFLNDLDLSDADRTLATDSQASLLADAAARPGTAVAWANAKSGNSGVVVFIKSFDYHGLPCRGLEHRVRQRGLSDPINFRIAKCQVADGTWKTL